MRQWNGWGDQRNQLDMEINSGLKSLLSSLLGPSNSLPEASLEQVIASVPKSRLPKHRLVDTDPELRVRHARGQSLPDWLAMHSGDIGAFPDGVAFPESAEQVRDILHYAALHNVSVIPYGGGTSVVGHINPDAGDRPKLTVSMAKMNKMTALDKQSQLATFGAGTPGPEIESQLKKEGYTLGHFPQSWELSTIGGWVASRSSGQQSLRYGRIEQLFAGAQMETFKGPVTIPAVPASSAGPDIREMILGSEGRLGVISEVTVRVSALPEQESFHVVFFPSWQAGLDAVREIVQARIPLSMIRLSNPLETISLLYISLGEDPSALMALEESLAESGIGSGKVMMTFAVTGCVEQCAVAKKMTCEKSFSHGGITDKSGLGDEWPDGRFSAPYLREPLGAAGYVVDTMETAVNWCNVESTAEAIEQAIRNGLADEDEKVHVYTHLSHVYGQGCSTYTTYVYRIGDSYDQALQRWNKLKKAGAEQIVAHGGTISHQHGVGADHRSYLSIEKGPMGIAAIESLCQLFDPDGLMNPGKLLPDISSKEAK